MTKITRFEKARVISARALQLALGAPPLIKAENEKSARELTEFFLGDCPDLSTNEYRNKFNFSIIEREMTYNDAFEAEMINNNG